MKIIVWLSLCLSFFAPGNAQKGTIVDDQINSTVLGDNMVALNTSRKVKVYLPAGYDTSTKSYPVVYYFHSIFGSAEHILGGDHLTGQLERAVANNVIKEVIVVAADYSTATVGSLYENSPVSGRWLDFTVEELVPFIDKKFRTIKSKNSRAATGDFMGGRGALVLAMKFPEVFGVVYAIHPVATGIGNLPWKELGIDWKKVIKAKTPSELSSLAANDRTRIFITICQAFLPNKTRPPFYCDFFMRLENDVVKVNIANMLMAKHGFHLEEMVAELAGNMKKLRGIAFDWARYDGNYDHIQSARAFSRDLDDFDIKHEAEEYNGTPWNNLWNDNGRFYSRMLPFLNRHLVFE